LHASPGRAQRAVPAVFEQVPPSAEQSNSPRSKPSQTETTSPMQSKKTMIHAVSGILLFAATATAQSQPPRNTGYKPATGTCGTLWPNGSYNPETGGSAVDGHW